MSTTISIECKSDTSIGRTFSGTPISFASHLGNVSEMAFEDVFMPAVYGLTFDSNVYDWKVNRDYNSSTYAAFSPVGVLMSFEIPTSLTYKQIEKVKLKYKTGAYQTQSSSSGNMIHNNSVLGYVQIAHMAYADSELAESLTFTNFDKSKIVYNGLTNIEGGADFVFEADESYDITSLFRNNVYNGIFNALEYAMPYTYWNDGGRSTHARTIKDRTSAVPPTLEITYSGSAPEVFPIAPVNEFLSQNGNITFQWSFNSASGAQQDSWLLEKSTDGTTWTQFASGNGSDTSYTCSSDLLGTGKIYWRVKVTDNDGEQSDYSSTAVFTIMTPPSAPTLTGFTNECLPTLTWNASGQAAYELEILSSSGNVIESSSRATTEKSYTVKTVLQNGTYTVKLRIANSYEMWSDVSSRQYTISATSPTAPVVTITKSGTHVEVETQNDSELLLYRTVNGKTEFIKKFTGSTNDYTAPSGKECTYFARLISEGYADSTGTAITITIDGISLYCDGVELNCALSRDQFMPTTRSVERDEAIIHYAGRELPVRESGPQITRSITRTFVVPKADIERLEAMKLSDNPIVYRDADGNVMSAVISSRMSAANYLASGFNVTLTFVEVE